jgi:hypothetical protein
MKNLIIILLIIIWYMVDTNFLLSGIPFLLIPIKKLVFIQEQSLRMANFFRTWNKTSFQDDNQPSGVKSSIITSIYALGFLSGEARKMDDNLVGGSSLTSNKKEFERNFGKVLSQKVSLNSFGEIVIELWSLRGKRLPYAIQHTYVIMPDHLQGITEIKRNLFAAQPLDELIGSFKMNSSKPIRMLGRAMNHNTAA